MVTPLPPFRRRWMESFAGLVWADKDSARAGCDGADPFVLAPNSKWHCPDCVLGAPDVVLLPLLP